MAERVGLSRCLACGAPRPAASDAAGRGMPAGGDEGWAALDSSAPAWAVPAMPLGTVLALVGGLALVGAFYMPWFAVQGLLLSGSFPGRFLASPADVQRFMPALAASPGEVQLLRALVYLFPACGGLAAVLALLQGLRRGRPGRLGIALAACGLVPLVALGVGLSRLPPGVSPDVGIWLMGAGSVAVALGPLANRLLAR